MFLSLHFFSYKINQQSASASVWLGVPSNSILESRACMYTHSDEPTALFTFGEVDPKSFNNGT